MYFVCDSHFPPLFSTAILHITNYLFIYHAYNEQAKEDGDKPGLEAMLQKVLQLYASKVLSKRTYAIKGMFVVLVFYVENLFPIR